MSTDRDREEAKAVIKAASKEICDFITKHFEVFGVSIVSLDCFIQQRMEQALAARVQPFIDAGLSDEQGRPRKVLGTLVLTFDGAIVSHGATIHHPVSFRCNDAQHSVVDGPSFDMVLAEASVADQDHKRPPFVCWGGPQHDCAYINECYSTRELALAARRNADE